MAEPQVLIIGAEDEENLAIRSLAAFLMQHGIPACVAGFSQAGHTESILRLVRRRRPTVLAVSMAFQSKAKVFFALLRRIREAGYGGHIVVGGHFPTFEYRTLLQTVKDVDSVARYEGEYSLVELALAVADGKGLESVPNLAYRVGAEIRENPCIQEFMDLDKLPFPIRERRPQRRLGERFGTVVSGRGCWHSRCAYCCIGAFHQGKTRKFALRSPANVAEEIAYLHHEKGVRLIQFHDDNFILPSADQTCRRLESIAQELEARRVRVRDLAFLIKARPDGINDAVAAALRDFGCAGIFLGIENATESGLRALARGAALSDIGRALAALCGRGMAVTYNLLIFHPLATTDEIRHNIAFMRGHADLAFDFGRAEIVAGSPLERLVRSRGILRGEWPGWDYEIGDPVVQRMFEINRVTFRAHHAWYPGLMHALIALSYHASILTRLHDGPSARALAHAVSDLIADVNAFVAECLDQALHLAEEGRGDAAALAERLNARCRGYLGGADALSREMLNIQTAERIFDRLGVKAAVQSLPLFSSLFGFRRGVESDGVRRSEVDRC